MSIYSLKSIVKRAKNNSLLYNFLPFSVVFLCLEYLCLIAIKQAFSPIIEIQNYYKLSVAETPDIRWLGTMLLYNKLIYIYWKLELYKSKYRCPKRGKNLYTIKELIVFLL